MAGARWKARYAVRSYHLVDLSGNQMRGRFIPIVWDDVVARHDPRAQPFWSTPAAIRSGVASPCRYSIAKALG